MEVDIKITSVEAFDAAVKKVSMEMMDEMPPSSAFIMGMTNIIFTSKLRRELFEKSEEKN